MDDEKKPISKVVAKLEYEQRFNLGDYQHEMIKISLEGPFEDVRDGKDLPRLMLYTVTNMKRLTQKVHEGVDPRKYDGLDGQGIEVVKEGDTAEDKEVQTKEGKTEEPKKPEPKKQDNI
jgi:hypothetical protein